MRRLWPVALVVVAACGTNVAQVTPKPSVAASSPVASATPAASLPPRCKLPFIEPSTAGGFLLLPEGTYTSDPGSNETFDATTKNLRSAPDPAFHGPQDYSLDQPVFDARSSRWLPVPRSALSPDGSRYVYSQYLYPPNTSVTSLPAPTGSLIRVVTIATGEDKVIYQGPPYDVVGWKPEGVYLTRPCTDRNCRTGGGLWLLDPGRGVPQQLAAPPAQPSGVSWVPMWSALGGGAAWALGGDPSNGHADRLLRHDLNGGAESIWFSRPASTWMSLLGISSGVPILVVTENGSMGVWRITARDTAQIMMTMPIVQTSGPGGDQLAPATPQGAPLEDRYGTWFGTNAGVFLQTSDGTVRKMSDRSGAVAGTCS